MKNIWLLVIVSITLFIAGIVTFVAYDTDTPQAENSPSITQPSPTTPTPSQEENSSDCSPSQVNATLTTEPAAGTVYAELAITNTSGAACIVQLDNEIEVNGIDERENVTVSHIGNTTSPTFLLPDEASLYADISFPNGPQCTEVDLVSVSFTYQISRNSQVTFTLPSGQSSITIQACESPLEQTEITLSNFSTTSSTP